MSEEDNNETGFQPPKDFEGDGAHASENIEDKENPFYEVLELADLEKNDKIFYPKNSVIHDWMIYGKDIFEMSENQILSAILPVISGIVGRRYYCKWFGGTKLYPNVFILIIQRAGGGKSTMIRRAKKIAQRCMYGNAFNTSKTSDSKMFDDYDPEMGGNPDKILIVGEANGIFTNWVNDSHGKEVRARYLELYDCEEYRLAYKSNTKDDGENRSVPETSTSVLMGATPQVLHSEAISPNDGMHRRFLIYGSLGEKRIIREFGDDDERDIPRLSLLFDSIMLKGKETNIGNYEKIEIQLSQEARRLLLYDIKDYIREYKTNLLPDNGSQKSACLESLYSTQLTHIAKVAMIFQLAIYAKNPIPSNLEISKQIILLAFKHVEQVIREESRLMTQGANSRIKDFAQSIIAKIRLNNKESNEKWVRYSRTEMTGTFAKHGGRNGSLTGEELNEQVIPMLIEWGDAKNAPKRGRTEYYDFRLEN